jgi:DNA repair exonuclease SbcCD nuclease subunit
MSVVARAAWLIGMKIAIMSDMHFGFAQGTEREEDSFEAASEAMEKALASDIILVPGDIFDSRVPGTEVLAKSMEIFTKPILSKRGAELCGAVGKNRDDISPKSLLGTPVIAIHGTHERRAKGLMNPVQAMEKAGFLIHLHCNGVIFKNSAGEKIAVHGMSGVPDQYTGSILKEWGPKPVPGCMNILMMHQSVKEFMHEKVPHTISLMELPKGFDLYLLGHMHRPEKSSYAGSPVLVAGSLIPTQLTAEDSARSKGIWIFDTASREPDFVPLRSQRVVYFIENEDMNGAEREIKRILSGAHAKKPIIRIRGRVRSELEKDIRSMFGDRAIISFRKEAEEKEIPTRTLEEHRLSVQDLGKKLLEENLGKFGLDAHTFEQVFELLLEGMPDEALDVLVKKGHEPKKHETEPVAKGPEIMEKQTNPLQQKPAAKGGRGLEKFI